MGNQNAALRTPSSRPARGRNLTNRERAIVNFMCYTHTPTEEILEKLEQLQLKTNSPPRRLTAKTISNIKGLFNRVDKLEAEFEEAGENATSVQADGAIVAHHAREILLYGRSLSGASFNALFNP